jgi:hypothetical protein
VAISQQSPSLSWAIVLLLLQHMLAFCSSSKLTIPRASLAKFTGTCQTFQSPESPKHPFAHSKGSLQPDGLSHLIWRVLTLVSGTTFPFKHINHAWSGMIYQASHQGLRQHAQLACQGSTQSADTSAPWDPPATSSAASRAEFEPSREPRDRIQCSWS